MRFRIDRSYALSYSSLIGAKHRTEPGEAATTSGAGLDLVPGAVRQQPEEAMGTKHTTWAAPVTYGASKFKVMTDELHARPVAVVNTLEDARLIAAAPETTSALAAALDDLEAALPALRNAGWQTHNEEATIRRGRAVLEKATGASNGN